MTASTESAKGNSPTAVGQWISLPGARLRLNGRSRLLEDYHALPEPLTSRVEFLDLRDLPIPPDMMHWIASLPALRTLVLAGCLFEDADIARLSSSASLGALDLSCTSLTSVGLNSIEGLKNLRSLILSRTKIDDDACVVLGNFAKLEALRVQHTLLTEEGMAGIASLSGLRELEPPSFFGDESLQLFKDHRQLSALWLLHTHITDHGFDSFPENDTLRILSLPYGFTEAGCRTLARFSGLSTLWFESAALTRESFAALYGLKKLTTLFIGPSLEDEPMRALCALPHLRRLCLMARPSRYQMEMLTTAGHLEELRVNASNLDDVDSWMFGKMPALKNLQIFDSSFSAATVVRMREALPNARIDHPLRRCELSSPLIMGEVYARRFTSEGSAPWLRVEFTHNSFTFPVEDELSFRMTWCDDQSQLIELGECAGRHFVELRFDSCAISSDFVSALPLFSALASVELRACAFERAFLSAIAALPKLTKLILDFSKFSDDDVDTVLLCKSLTELHVRETQLTGRGIATLAGMPGLRRLLIEGTDIVAADLAELRAGYPGVSFS
ncbi:MAG: hypothetical protein ABI579_09265 [Candidatus Sumerlaeota bacterium]